MITSLLRPNYVMNCTDFSNNCLEKVVVTVQGSFTRDIRNTYFKNSLEGCFGNLNVIYTGRNEKKVIKDLQVVLDNEIMEKSQR